MSPYINVRAWLYLSMLFEALCIFPVDRANALVWQTTILTSEEESFRDQTMRRTIGIIEIIFWRCT